MFKLISIFLFLSFCGVSFANDVEKESKYIENAQIIETQEKFLLYGVENLINDLKVDFKAFDQELFDCVYEKNDWIDKCNVVAFKLQNHKYVHLRKDEFQVYSFFSKTCKAGSDFGCFNVALMLFNGNGVRQDYAKSLNLFKKLCNDSFDDVKANSCVNAGYFYEFGFQNYNFDDKKDSKTKKVKNALEYYGKGCDYKSRDGCVNYASLNKKENREFKELSYFCEIPAKKAQ